MKIPSLVEAYGAIQSRLEPRLQELTASGGFSQAVAVTTTMQSVVGRTIDGVNARILHALNLPAGTDIKRLRRQIGDLDHEVRTLRLELTRYLEERGDASTY
ncbi:hypothetical protein FOS14_12565 [Skermania sp. ID1734]|uniref:hypothetical protein n=1 Tax=Skermania sp. ID1734 TaxID=2597516 RepID=UPI00117C5B3B|nr:hypothetical protein [Skermania sp. ID1734]TSD99196.1 hypothetical protein FOS14_12565 [Skermania sp. ID1734]